MLVRENLAHIGTFFFLQIIIYSLVCSVLKKQIEIDKELQFAYITIKFRFYFISFSFRLKESLRLAVHFIIK